MFDIDLCIQYSYVTVRKQYNLRSHPVFQPHCTNRHRYHCILVCFHRVDLNLCVKVGDFGFTRETNCKASQTPKCPVKWMPPEMLQDGISSEKTDVVGCIKIRQRYTVVSNNKCTCANDSECHK